MATVLHIAASPMGRRSFSRRAATAFLDTYRQCRPDDRIDELDLWRDALPEFDEVAASGKYHIMQEKPFTDQEKEAWEAVLALIQRLRSAEKVVISSPMWNFGIPYKLKQFVDGVVQPGHTFSYSAEEGYAGLLTGRPVQLILARGSAYGAATPMEAMDFQKPYLEAVLKFIGFADIRSLVLEPTMQFGGAETEAMLVRARRAGEAF